jgi:hypothetical protein
MMDFMRYILRATPLAIQQREWSSDENSVTLMPGIHPSFPGTIICTANKKRFTRLLFIMATTLKPIGMRRTAITALITSQAAMNSYWEGNTKHLFILFIWSTTCSSCLKDMALLSTLL